ncbi:hypothetical protein FAGKG844_240006 [Frankia sp. AgKG'84/4]
MFPSAATSSPASAGRWESPASRSTSSRRRWPNPRRPPLAERAAPVAAARHGRRPPWGDADHDVNLGRRAPVRARTPTYLCKILLR